MSRNKLTLISAAAAILMAAALIGGVWLAYFPGGGVTFNLPTLIPPELFPKNPIPGISGQSFRVLTVDAGNVQSLLASVERPDGYSRTVECVTYWPGGEETVTHNFAHRGNLTRVETFRGAHPVQHRLVTPLLTYVWTSAVIHEVSPEGASAEALAGIPTWEDIISLPADSILHAEYFYLPGERVLRIETQEAVYRGEYLLSLETGLLMRAAFTDADGYLAYEVRAKGPPVVGDPGDELFTLPDGRVVG